MGGESKITWTTWSGEGGVVGLGEVVRRRPREGGSVLGGPVDGGAGGVRARCGGALREGEGGDMVRRGDVAEMQGRPGGNLG